MLNVLFILSVSYTIYKLIKEMLEKPKPSNIVFDWDAYWKDIENGMSTKEQIKKRKNGGYDVIEPLPKNKNIKKN